MKKTPVEIDIEIFPCEIRYLFENAAVYDSSCSKDATVYYLDSGYYIKIDKSSSLAAEAKMCKIFHNAGLGVEVVAYVCGDKDYLVTRAADGDDLTHFLDYPEKLCKLLADALRNLHSQPIAGIPVSAGYARYMEAAVKSISDGCFDDHVLINRYMIMSKEEAFKIIQKHKHALLADTLVHGDACLPNIIQCNGKFSAFIDLNLAGIGNKHTDIYWALWSLQYNLKTEDYTDMFLDMYGRNNFNEEMLKVIAAYEFFG
jgi:kanamycin kinase